MNNTKILTAIVLFLITAAGCTQTKVLAPPVSRIATFEVQPEIVEQRIDPLPEENDYFQSQTAPQPIEQPVFENTTRAERQGSCSGAAVD